MSGGSGGSGAVPWLRRLLLLLAFCAAAPLAAAAEPSPELRQRAGDLVTVLGGQAPSATLFAPAFLAAVPEAHVRAIAEQLRQSYGAPRSLAGIDAANPYGGTVHVAYERATLDFSMALDPEAPHLVTSLLLVGTGAGSGDTVQAALRDLTALPGEMSLAAATLTETGAKPFLTQAADRPMAVGSAFKLFVLAELVREIKAGERRWSDVVPLGPPSLPFSTLRTWPPGSPITLHSLAALMISQSDNTAADTLVALLGREKIERLLPALGVQAAARDRPLLLTREAALLKGNPALRSRWAAADEPGRRALLRGDVARADPGALDLSAFDAAPIAIAQVEWFASASDLVRSLDWLRRNGDATALAILAINPGLPPATRDFAYAGYKGGSETGVLNMSFLLRRRDGRWIAVAVTWNDPQSRLDENRLALLVTRLLPLLAKADGDTKTR